MMVGKSFGAGPLCLAWAMSCLACGSGEAPSVAPPPPRVATAPAISGGTLLVTRSGGLAVAADPTVDRIWVVDLLAWAVIAEHPLPAGSEPGRLVEDGSGRIHAVLRGSGELASFEPRAGATVERRGVCPAPRGLAFDPTSGFVMVACAGGELVSMPTSAGPGARVIHLAGDLRDVVFESGRLLVTTFRSAQVFEVARDGTSVVRALPPSRSDGRVASVAWRAVALPGGGVGVLHQRASTRALVVAPPGATPSSFDEASYGTSDTGPIVTTAVSRLRPDHSADGSPALDAVPLALDVAFAPDRSSFAVVSGASPEWNSTRLVIFPTAVFTNTTAVASLSRLLMPSPPVAVAYTPDSRLVVQTRNPPQIVVGERKLRLGEDDTVDLGRDLFHAVTRAGIACASCHPEGGDDGRVWNFRFGGIDAPLDPRRTQSLRVGLRGTAPFHWSGDVGSFRHLANEVFTRRMGGRALSDAEVDSLETWIDAREPVAPSAPSDPAAVARGYGLYHDADVGCASCHGGAALSNNTTVDVGTGGAFQVPSLRGVASHPPYLHDGRAPTLRARFDPSGGGDRHGHTSALSASQLDDLVAYLEVL